MFYGGQNVPAAVESYPFQSWFQAYGVPDWIAKGILQFEGNVPTSQVNPDTGGTLSIGPLQLNTGGQAAGYSPQQLAQDPAQQAAIGVPPIAAAYQSGLKAGLSGLDLFLYTAANSGHPTEAGVTSLGPSASARLASIYQQVAPSVSTEQQAIQNAITGAELGLGIPFVVPAAGSGTGSPVVPGAGAGGGSVATGVNLNPFTGIASAINNATKGFQSSVTSIQQQLQRGAIIAAGVVLGIIGLALLVLSERDQITREVAKAATEGVTGA